MKKYSHIAGVCAIAVVLGAAALSIGNDYYLHIAFMMCVYYLCAAGMNVLVGFAGQKSLGQAGLFGAGAYAVALLTSQTEINPWAAMAIATAISGVCGVLIALPSLRVKGPYLAMVTLAFGIVVERLVSDWTDVFGGAKASTGFVARKWWAADVARSMGVRRARFLRGYSPVASQPAEWKVWPCLPFASS